MSEDVGQKREEETVPGYMEGSELIAAERKRQVEAEGWTPQHDDQHDYWELSKAAVGYLGAPGAEWSGKTGVRGGRTPQGYEVRPCVSTPTPSETPPEQSPKDGSR